MKRALLAAGLAASTFMIAAPAAHAGTGSPCVSRPEFRHVVIQPAGQKPAMKMHRVHQIFDTHGVLVSKSSSSDGTLIVMRKYRFCGYTMDEAFVTVAYVRHHFGHPLRAYSKHWYINV